MFATCLQGLQLLCIASVRHLYSKMDSKLITGPDVRFSACKSNKHTNTKQPMKNVEHNGYNTFGNIQIK